MQKKMSLSKLFCLIAASLVLVSIFFMFGHAIHWHVDASTPKVAPSLFQLAFGVDGGVTIPRRSGFTALFVIEVLAMCASIMVFLCAFNVLLGETAVGIFAIISSVFSLVVLILAFCSRPLVGDLFFSGHAASEATLGFGSILLGVAHTLAIGLNVFAIISDRNGK